MKRLASLDALRGFDMFWIMGGEAFLGALVALFGVTGFGPAFDHVPWHGLHFMDCVFPTFLFLAGVSFPFSAAASAARGLSPRAIALRCLRRGLTLFALGIVFNGFLQNPDVAHFRVWSVLGRIGLAWMVAAWVALAVTGMKGRLAIAVAILAGVTAFTLLVPAPGAAPGADVFSPEGNFGCWLDRTLTGGHTYQPLFDPEGFAGFLPAVVTALLGVLAGDWIRGRAVTGRTALVLLVAGVGLSLAGLAWSFVFPINKALWSPSFTLVVGGFSMMALAAFYWVIDVKGCGKWAFPFKVIGMNSITIYLAQPIIGFGTARQFFFGAAIGNLPAGAAAVLAAVAYVALCWLFLYFLYRKNVFLKV